MLEIMDVKISLDTETVVQVLSMRLHKFKSPAEEKGQ